MTDRLKPWVTDAADRAYLETQYTLLDAAAADVKRISRRITHREHKVWDHGGRERYLADEVARHNQEPRTS